MKLNIDNTLYKWIVLSCIALAIPILCAIINVFISKNLVEGEVNKVNAFVLQNIQYNIDDRLDDISELLDFHLLNSNFNMYTLNVENERLFREKVNKWYDTMRLSYGANPNIETVLYIPSKEYIINSNTANEIEYIYGSLIQQKKLEISLDEWKEVLMSQKKNRYTIAENTGYINVGRESIVYSMGLPQMDSKNSNYLNFFVSVDFIEELMNEEVNDQNTVFILDENNTIIGKYGNQINIDGMEIQLPENESTQFEVLIAGDTYISSYTKSNVARWTYIVCTPKSIFTKDIWRNFYLNLIVILMGGIISIIAMIVLQNRNFKPVKKLMEIIPVQENEEYESDDFIVFEKNLRRLYEENISMQTSIEKRKENDKELALLLALKGRRNYLTNLTTEDLLGEGYSNKRFMLVSTRLDADDVDSLLDRKIDFNLLAFLVDNIVMEVLGVEFTYIKTLDDRQLVFLYIIDESQLERWNTLYLEKYLFIDEFLQNRIDLELAITIGKCFSDFDYIQSAYAKLEEINERRYFTKPYGVVTADEMSSSDSSSMEQLLYYSKYFEEATDKGDFNEVRIICNELFSKISNAEQSFNASLYYVLALINNILIALDYMEKEDLTYIKSLEINLENIRKADSINVLQSEFYQFLKLIYKEIDFDNEDLSLSEKIKTFVAENYMDCNMNISTIADTIGLTPRYMSKIFKEQTSVNLLSYINGVRIEHAKALLKTTNKTVDQISEETGFSNVRTFRRNFQKAAGVTAIVYKMR